MVVAEMSANHLGRLERALTIVDAAADAGADAIKIQLWDPDRMVIDRTYTVKDGPWAGRNLYELYNECRTPWGWVRQIFEHARHRNILAFASVFDTLALEYLELLKCPIYKIASFEIIDLPLIEAVARTGKPMILSTGMASEEEIELAVIAARGAGCQHLTVLYCSSAYPAELADLDLMRIRAWRNGKGWDVGFSDHTLGMTAATVATVLGATVIEKHLTLLRSDGGPDAAFSTEPEEFKAMVQMCRIASSSQPPGPGQEAVHAPLRRSLYFTKSLPAGHILSAHDVRSARPADGVSPIHLPVLMGRQLARAVRAGEPVAWDALFEGKPIPPQGPDAII